MSRSLISRRILYCLAASLLCLPSLYAQDYIGILPEMLKPEVAEDLKLSEEQREQVRKLIRQRQSAAIALGQQLREATPDQQEQLREQFGEESERLAFELLSEDQQSRLAEIRIESMGMLSLVELEVATALNLADWQKEMVAQWAERVRRDRHGRSAEKTRNMAEQAIRSELSESQWDAWRLMAGLIQESTLGPPMPPVFQDETDVEIRQGVAASPEENARKPLEEVRLELNFQGQPWGDVIRWLADQADLSLQSDVVPPGTFNYRDLGRTYSVTEAMDIMNASLLTTGYTMVKSGRMLRVVNFEEEEIATEFISEIADWVDADELGRRGDYEPVKFTFRLKRLDPDEVSEDIEQLISIQGSVRSIPSTGEVVVTDLARNVRAIQSMLERAEDPQYGRGSTIMTFPLEHINAEEVLTVARPLLELEEDINTSDEIKISTDTFGTKIYAIGEADKIQNLKELVEQMDVAPTEDESVIVYEKPELRRHKVIGIDLELAYQIVSQLLAGAPDVRLAQDTASKQLMLMARPSEHQLIEDTLAKLAGESSDFEVIQLQKLDVQLAISAINKFFGLTDGAEETEGRPVIDGDIFARQVWVKGSETQVAQIREFLTDLEENAANSNLLGDTVISIPLTGRSADRALEQAQQLWQQMNNHNRLRVISAPGSRGGQGLEQKTVAPDAGRREAALVRPPADQSPRPISRSEDDSDKRASVAAPNFLRNQIPLGRLTASPQEDLPAGEPSPSDSFPADATTPTAEASEQTDESDILIMPGPSGLIVSSSDKEALARFQAMMQLFADQAAYGSVEPTVIYLKNIKASAAKELLETILSGQASSGGGGGSLLGDMAGSVLGGFGGGMVGAMLGGGGGDLIGSGEGLASGDYTITADPRLNALIVKASPLDMSLIEQLLEVIDQVESPIAIETRGQVAMIPVITQEVGDVLNVIKQLYGDRIVGNSSGGGSRGGGGGDRGGPDPAEFIRALRGGGRGGRGGGDSTELDEPKISISAEPSTNMLLVIAQPQDIEEIRDLVNLIDEAGKADQEEIAYATLDGVVSADLFQESVTRMLGPQAQANVSQQDSSSEGSSRDDGDSRDGGDRSEAQRQAARRAFFERLRQGGGFGGRRPGSSGGRTGGFGGRPGGFGGFGGRGGGDRGGR